MNHGPASYYRLGRIYPRTDVRRSWVGTDRRPSLAEVVLAIAIVDPGSIAVSAITSANPAATSISSAPGTVTSIGTANPTVSDITVV